MRYLASLKLTVVLLFFLCVLVFWGTIEQVNLGLYLAQEKFFNSYFIKLAFIPIPSARSILWLLFFNLSTALVLRFKGFLQKPALLLLHLGLIVLLISGFVTLHFSKESFINLHELEQTNIASDYMNWQLYVKETDKSSQAIKEYIIPEKDLKAGQELGLKGLQVATSAFYTNARIFDTPFAGRILKELKTEKDFEKNIRAIKLSGENFNAELEGEVQPSYIYSNENHEYKFTLRRVRTELPFSIRLLDVSRILYPGTQKPKSYSSKIAINENGIDRELEISMNKPFRTGLYTVYQASYGIDDDGNEFTVLSVVKNLSYMLPYYGTLITALGLLVYFLQAFIRKVRQSK